MAYIIKKYISLINLSGKVGNIEVYWDDKLWELFLKYSISLPERISIKGVLKSGKVFPLETK